MLPAGHFLRQAVQVLFIGALEELTTILCKFPVLKNLDPGHDGPGSFRLQRYGQLEMRQIGMLDTNF